MRARWWRSRFGGSLARELVIVVALLLLYKYGRFLVRGHMAAADRNAHRVIGLERGLGVFTEARLQDLVVTSATVVGFLNTYYLVAHVAMTAAAFLWLYIRHPEGYRRFRNVMVIITLAGMLVHLVFPLAPPRMFPRLGFVDTAPYKGFANQIAAMPSLHFGWALVIAWATVLVSPSRWRFAILAHPVLTLAAIVLTANHYWLDAVVATLLFVIALVVDHVLERRRTRRAARTVAPPAETARPPVPRDGASCRGSPSRRRRRTRHEPAAHSDSDSPRPRAQD
jgi:PAP2 superfamily